MGRKHQLRSENAFFTSCKPTSNQRFGSTKAGIANTHARTTPSLEVVSPAVQLVLAAVQESSDTQQLPADYSGTVFLHAAYTEKLPLACIWQMFICSFQICFFSKMFLSFLCFFSKDLTVPKTGKHNSFFPHQEHLHAKLSWLRLSSSFGKTHILRWRLHVSPSAALQSTRLR